MAEARTSVGGLSEGRRKLLVTGALALLCLLMFRALLTRRDFISDDAWISMRYARNLVEGHGLVWNAGYPPVEGYSNLLWVLLGALGVALHLPMPLWINGMGLAMSAATLFATYACVRVAGGSPRWGLFAAALCSVNFLIAGTALLGLETPSLTLLMTVGTWRALAEEGEIRAGRAAFPWSALCFGLLTIAHIEGPLYLVVPVAIRASRWLSPEVAASGPGADRRRDWIAAALLFAFPVGQELLRVLYYGDWIPNTMRVKTLGNAAHTSLILGARYVLLSLTANKALGALCGMGAVAALARRRGVSRADRVAGAALLLPWLCCAVFSLAAKGDMINQVRFMAPAAPTLLAVCAVGWERLLAIIPRALSLGIVGVPIGLGLTAAHRDLSIQMVAHNRGPSIGPPGAMASVMTVLEGSYGRVMEFSRPLGRLWSPDPPIPLEAVPWFMEWVLENIPVGETVMFPDVGALGYALSDGLVLDARGLNSRGPAALIAASPAEGPEGMKDPGVVAFLKEFHEMQPAGLVLQTASGTVWGPPEAALQGDGALDAYRGVATGRYTSHDVRIYTLGHPKPTRAEVLARYRRMMATMPGVFDWAGREKELENGPGRAAEADSSTTEEVTLYPAGAWYRSATFPPGGGG